MASLTNVLYKKFKQQEGRKAQFKANKNLKKTAMGVFKNENELQKLIKNLNISEINSYFRSIINVIDLEDDKNIKEGYANHLNIQINFIHSKIQKIMKKKMDRLKSKYSSEKNENTRAQLQIQANQYNKIWKSLGKTINIYHDEIKRIVGKNVNLFVGSKGEEYDQTKHQRIRNELWKKEMKKEYYTEDKLPPTHPIQGGRRKRTRKKKGGCKWDTFKGWMGCGTKKSNGATPLSYWQSKQTENRLISEEDLLKSIRRRRNRGFANNTNPTSFLFVDEDEKEDKDTKNLKFMEEGIGERLNTTEDWGRGPVDAKTMEDLPFINKDKKDGGGRRKRTRKKRGGNTCADTCSVCSSLNTCESSEANCKWENKDGTFKCYANSDTRKDICVICQEKMPDRNTKSIIQLKNCNHRFHIHCMVRSFYEANSDTCPLCRQSIHFDDIIKIDVHHKIDLIFGDNPKYALLKNQTKNKIFKTYDILKQRFTFLSKIKGNMTNVNGTENPQNTAIIDEVMIRIIRPIFSMMMDADDISPDVYYYYLMELAFHMLYVQEIITPNDEDPNKDVYDAIMNDIQKGINENYIKNQETMRLLPQYFPQVTWFIKGGRRRKTRKKKGGRKDKKKDKKLHEKEKTTVQYRQLTETPDMVAANRYRQFVRQERRRELERQRRIRLERIRLERQKEREIKNMNNFKKSMINVLKSLKTTKDIYREMNKINETKKKWWKEYMKMAELEDAFDRIEYYRAQIVYGGFRELYQIYSRAWDKKLKEEDEKRELEQNEFEDEVLAMLTSKSDDERKEGGSRKKSRRKKRRRKKRTKKR